MYRQSNFSYIRATRTFKDRFICKVNLYRGTKISVFSSQFEDPGIKYFQGSAPDLLQGFRSSLGFPMPPSSKKLYLGHFLYKHQQKLVSFIILHASSMMHFQSYLFLSGLFVDYFITEYRLLLMILGAACTEISFFQPLLAFQELCCASF